MHQCLLKNNDGEIEHNFGIDVKIGDVETMLEIPVARRDEFQLPKKRKREAGGTPQKTLKKQPVTSTPVKLK